MSRWTERTKPYDRPKDYEVLTPESIWEFVDRRTRTGMDASLFLKDAGRAKVGYCCPKEYTQETR